MKRALLVVTLALPLAADEATKPQPKAAPAPQPAAAQQAQPDSPLVAAARRSKRLGRKPVAPVITNETLRKSGGDAHITTTNTPQGLKMPPVLPPPHPTPEMQAATARAAREKAAAEQAAKTQAAADEQRQKAERAAAAAEEGYDGTTDDGAEFVGSAPPPR